ncbi:metallophosphoesterase [Jeotgalibacillus soli]|uniref:Calcineurin-like phosphoesterase domain-containing protein n=1 Tax=Jeotgalibacillus soli TaxID=889306 RepID=A0A0C2V9F8_9BACL|nr:metallophosphoesterase [Jeotgalibacillus soli]KIL45577.1 hypothetical protein KP78_19260 [Jeotgalibacillus soli]
MTFLNVLAVLVTISIYGLLSYYVGYTGWNWLKSSKLPQHKKGYVTVMVLLSTAYFLGSLLSFLPLEIIGAYWFVVIGYSLILFPAANIVVYILKKKNIKNGTFWTGIGVIGFFFFILVYGSINAWNPIVRTYDITVEKSAEVKELQILMVSDLHLGPIVGEKHIQRMVEIADDVKPDIILIAGDIIDDNVDPFIEKEMGKHLEKMNAPLGVYAIPGNHDYYGDDLLEIESEMEQTGLTFLLDETESINNDFYIVGRKDLTDTNRETAEELVEELDKTKPIIMLDHQPVELDEASASGVDVILSGHTHRGQLAPANIITSMIYENDWGYLKKENLHSFVSSGFGTWGPPLRIGSRSEVMVINVTFK